MQTMEPTEASPATSCAAPVPAEPGTEDLPAQLTFGKIDLTVGKIVLKRRSPTLYEWESASHGHIKVVKAGEKWQGLMSVGGCCLPMSSLCEDPQQAADTLWECFMLVFTGLHIVQLKNL